MEEVHDLAYHGQGGFPISDVWDMPVPYRRYHIRMISKFNKERQEEIDNIRGDNNPQKPISKPNIPNKPTYTTSVKS
jgi:hypothetical protein